MLGLFAPHSLWSPVRETFKTVTSLLWGGERERRSKGKSFGEGGGQHRHPAWGIIARPGSNKRVEFRKRVSVGGEERGGERESLYFSAREESYRGEP